MDGLVTRWGRMANRVACVALACVMSGSCVRFEKSWVPGSAAALAKDQVMLVRIDPPSLGCERLMTWSQVYPDLLFFLRQQGPPDFLAETGDQNRLYLILYYLKQRRAYACRSRPGHAGVLEFAGPYPITDGEYRTLDSFRRRNLR